jgi:hypothetical protein
MPASAAHSARCLAPFTGHGEISVAARKSHTRAKSRSLSCGNHERLAGGARYTHKAPLSKILIEFDSVKFDENLPRNRVDFAQKHRFIANDSFRPFC